MNYRVDFSLGLVAIVLFQILIFSFFENTKIVVFLNGILLISLFSWYKKKYFFKLIEKETKAIISDFNPSQSEILLEKDITSLPPLIQKWLVRSGAIGKPKIQMGKVEQKILMKLKPNQKEWYPAQAIQYSLIHSPAFIWTVKMDMNKLMWMKGRDKFVDGKGEMLIKLNALFNVVNEKGNKISEGALQRFLSEIVWFPSFALSPYILWEQLNQNTAKATMSYQGTEGSAKFFFNEKGDFHKLVALRYRDNDLNAKRYEWVIKVNEYQFFEDIKSPSKLKITWKLDKEDWTWLDIEVSNIHYNENAYSSFKMIK